MPHSVKPVPVDIVSDVVCAWCVIGYYQLAAASRKTGVQIDVRWHPFELNPNMAEEGENLRDHLATKYGTTLENSIKSRAPDRAWCGARFRVQLCRRYADV
jgi:predicted DsbA family dithiol-disulfide isomerase